MILDFVLCLEHQDLGMTGPPDAICPMLRRPGASPVSIHGTRTFRYQLKFRIIKNFPTYIISTYRSAKPTTI